MTEDELKALKDLPAPAPSAEAKSMALAAALAAFDAGQKNNPDTAKGTKETARLTHASPAKRRQKMRVSTVSMKMAASLAALTVATVGTLYFAAPQFGERMNYESGGERMNYESGGERQTAFLERRRETGNTPKEQPFREGGKTVYDHIDAAGGRSAAPAPSSEYAPPPILQGTLEERIDKALSQDGLHAAQGGPATTVNPDDRSAQGGSGKVVFDRLAETERPRAPAPDTSIATAASRDDAKSFAGEPPAKPAPHSSAPEATAPGHQTQSGPFVIMQGEEAAGVNGDVRYFHDADGRLQLQKPEEQDRDKFEAPEPNPVKQVVAEPVSTFSIDVDTASYAFVRRALNDGRLPPKDAVRVEEMINYFPYDYPRPEAADAPFQPSVTVMPAPWKPANKLVHIGIKGYELVPTERPRANLVFLIDISGSMASADKLPLVKNAFRLMLDQLQPDDTVGLVTYASGSGIALEPTKVSEKRKILRALDALGAGGSTAGAQGLSDAYRLAEEHFDKSGVNRIILATDGDFNVGISDQDELKGFIERKREAGIFLSILGVGEGNYNDALMQTLAQNGNGTAAYVDTLNEARKVLVDEASSTLFTIARDVKIQVEFNPAQVSEYRLIGYETRALRREDFNNDKVDAGDVGSDHTVTAIYEITPKGAPKLVDELRYGAPGGAAQPAESAGQGGEYGFLKLRYKLPKEQASKLITLPITPALEKPDIGAAPDDVRFSVAVAGFGQLLRGLPYLGNYNYDDVLALAQGARGADPYGYRAEFLNLVRLAKSARP
jgi:Ca-activated chloride channel family protein